MQWTLTCLTDSNSLQTGGNLSNIWTPAKPINLSVYVSFYLSVVVDVIMPVFPWLFCPPDRAKDYISMQKPVSSL